MPTCAVKRRDRAPTAKGAKSAAIAYSEGARQFTEARCEHIADRRTGKSSPHNLRAVSSARRLDDRCTGSPLLQPIRTRGENRNRLTGQQCSPRPGPAALWRAAEPPVSRPP
jgi:hypothetical protein